MLADPACAELNTLIADSRSLRAELRAHLEVRRDIARDFRSRLHHARGFAFTEVRVMQMTSLLLEAHDVALRDENGLTIDLITDALTHLNERLEREVLARHE